MSTALVYCGLPDGFVIGTDSRAVNASTKEIENEEERKIFAFKSASASVVFAWAGTVKAGNEDSEVNLIEESNGILQKVDFQNFDKDFNARLRERISILRVITSGECAHGVFLYFWRGAPMGFEISVFKNGYTWDSCVLNGGAGTPSGEIVIVSGKKEESIDLGKATSLGYAKTLIERYIRDCIDDPKEKEIGGDVQIGTLTSEGFDWTIPPKA